MAEDPGHRCHPLLLIHLIENLRDGTFVMHLINTDLDRFVLDSRTHGGNPLRIGGGEKQGLLLFRRGGNDFADFFLKTHIQHPIGFIQDQRLQIGQIEAAAAQMVEEAARRADHDMGTMFQRTELGPEGNAAAEGQDLDVIGKTGQAAQLFADLIGQFPGRAQHQRLHA